jgi:hypothetical protein
MKGIYTYLGRRKRNIISGLSNFGKIQDDELRYSSIEGVMPVNMKYIFFVLIVLKSIFDKKYFS